MRRLVAVLVGTVAAAVLLGVLAGMLAVELRDAFSAGPTTVDQPGGPGTDELPVAPSAELPSAPPAGLPDDAEPATLDRVVDGDTIRVAVDDPGQSIPTTASVRVRLLNVDAPELARDDRPVECGAEAATQLLEDLLEPGEVVWLAPDREDRDVYDRPLRYAFTADGVDVQAQLVTAGLAEVIVVEPNDRFADALRALEEAARQAELGIWGELCPR